MQTAARFLVLFGLLVAFASCQFPLDCPDDGECCPATKDGEICGGPTRGECINADDWPDVNLTFCQSFQNKYDRVCYCYGNFFGEDCSLCKFGYEGENCEIASKIRTRRSIMEWSDEEIYRLIDKLTRMKFEIRARFTTQNGTPLSDYDFFSWFHLQATEWAHGGVGFPSWHRNQLIQFERDILTEWDGFALPYWNWTDEKANERVLRLFGGNGTDDVLEPGPEPWKLPGDGGMLAMGEPFSVWPPVTENGTLYPERTIRRCIACDEGALTPPSLEAVNGCLSTSEFDRPPYDRSVDRCGSSAGPDCVEPETTEDYSFRNCLEGSSKPNQTRTLPAGADMHNRVHVWIGGTLSLVQYSTNDPLFLLHHTYVDLIYEEWIRKHPDQIDDMVPDGGAPPGHNLKDCLGPFFPWITHEEIVGLSTRHGYTYDIYENPDKGGGFLDDFFSGVANSVLLALMICSLFVLASFVVIVALLVFGVISIAWRKKSDTDYETVE